MVANDSFHTWQPALCFPTVLPSSNVCKSDVRGNLDTKSHTVILEVGYAAIWGCLPPAVEVGCGEALPLYNLQHLCSFGPQGCALFPREIYTQGTIVKAPWKSTQPFPSLYPVFWPTGLCLFSGMQSTIVKAPGTNCRGKLCKAPPQEQSNSEPSLPS